MTSAPHVLVTGGASGIGEACARNFANAGAHVVIADRDGGRAATLADALVAGGESAQAVGVDVTDAAACRATFGALETLDAVVVSAGIGPARWVSLAETGEDEFDAMMAVSLRGAWLTLKHCWPRMRRPGGSIVMIGADCAVRGEANSGALSVAKHGVMGIVRTAAIEGMPEGLRVNAVCPARVATPIRHETAAEMDAILRAAPYGRLIAPGEVAAAVAWLAGPDAAYVNGTALMIDGGADASLATMGVA